MTLTATHVASSPASGGAVKNRWAACVADSIRSFFKTMLNEDVEVGPATAMSDNITGCDVSGIIGLTGDLCGSIVICFDFQTAEKIASTFAGMAVTPMTPEFVDSIGECVNIVAGGAKKAFGVPSNITVPSVVTGSHHVVARIKDVPCVVIPCRSSMGLFSVEVSVKQVR